MEKDIASMMRTTGKSPVGGMLPQLIVIIILIVGGIFVYRQWVAIPTLPSELRDDKYKAVFLNNGQVYFGKLEVANKDFLQIKNPYYLQTQTVLQEPVEEGAEPTTRQQLSLAAVGGENLQIHEPEQEMFIPWDRVLYVENLQDDSRVVELIEQSISGETEEGGEEQVQESQAETKEAATEEKPEEEASEEAEE